MSQTTRDIIKTFFETGDRPTQQQFHDWLDSVVWYDEVPKVYIAKISGNGTSAPNVTVIKNTLGGTVVLSRNNQSDYTATLAGVFTLNKTFISTAQGAGGGSFTNHIHLGVDSIRIVGTGADNTIVSNFLRIEVYP